MRISTSQIYQTGVTGMQRNQSALLKLQDQISSQTRILTPADDPVGASQVLLVDQSVALEQQYQVNHRSATGQLGLVDAKLSSLTNVLQSIRDNIVKAGGGSLTNTDRQSIADDVEASFNEIMAIANSDNGTGDYLFSGYQGATLPFATDTTQLAQPPAVAQPIAYHGDDGQRLVQVSTSRQMAVTVPGSAVFMNVQGGKGGIVVADGGNAAVSAAVGNTGTATANPVVVTDRQKWGSALSGTLAGQSLEIRFSAPVLPAVAPAVSYGIYDPVTAKTTGPYPYTPGNSIALVTAADPSLTPPATTVDFGASVVVSGVPVVGDSFAIVADVNQGTALSDGGKVIDSKKWTAALSNPLAGGPLEIRFAADPASTPAGVLSYSIYDPIGGSTALKPYTAGQQIDLVSKNGVDFGSQVVVSGTPLPGDSLAVTPSSTSQSIFQTVQNLIGTLRTPIDTTNPASNTVLANKLAEQLGRVDQALIQVGQVQSTIGANELELATLGSASSDLVIQYKATLSGLQDLDYTQALSDYAKQQVSLEAAQKSFVQISGLSLFKYI